MVLIRREGRWVPATLRSFGNEAELQQMLLDSPDLIPGCTGAAVVKEMTIPGAGAADLVAINELGDVWLVECKLSSNSQIRREVIGQILEYAGALWQLSYEDVERQFSLRAGRPMLEAIENTAAAGFDPDKCRRGIESSLSSGQFQLVIAIDQITEELKRTINYLNHHSAAGFAVVALELGLLKEAGLEVLVPAVYGSEGATLLSQSQGSTGVPSRPRWTEDAVAAAVDKSLEPGRSVVLKLLDHARRSRAVVYGGTGVDPSAGYYYRIRNQLRSLWSLYVRQDGPRIVVNFAAVAAVNEDLAQALLARLKENRILAELLLDVTSENMAHRFPELRASLLSEEGAVDGLLQGLSLVVGEPAG